MSETLDRDKLVRDHIPMVHWLVNKWKRRHKSVGSFDWHNVRGEAHVEGVFVMIATTDREGLELALETYPFDVVTRNVLADWLEEHGYWQHAAQRETARMIGKEEFSTWDHPIATNFLRHDKAWWQQGYHSKNPTKENYKPRIVVCRFPTAVSLHESWAVHPETGFRQENMTPGEYHEWMLVNYHQSTLHIYLDPNLFAKILVQEEFRRHY